MNNNDEFRANAAECQRMAESTQNAGDRKRWLKMAENWLRMIVTPRPRGDERFDAVERSKGTLQTKSSTSH